MGNFWRYVIKNPDWQRWLWWPVRLSWRCGSSLRFVDWHGWQVGNERCDLSKHSAGCMPGYRAVFGQTFHFGPLKLLLGKQRVRGQAS